MLKYRKLIWTVSCIGMLCASDVVKAETEVSVEMALLGVGQRALTGTLNDEKEDAFNFRGDISLSARKEIFDDATGEFFGHVRFGAGNGLERISPVLTGAVNSTVFADPDGDLTARIAQLWYEVDLQMSELRDERSRHLKVTAGKIDPFVFFDQNEIADDESAAFLNNVFVHNPMLDSGGHLEADEFGFAPGIRFAYLSEGKRDECWQASFGVFGKNKWSKPFLIGQIEAGGNYLFGKYGSYRLYAWTGSHYTPYANEFDTNVEKHSGWGISASQKILDHVTVFARYGHSTKGRVQFERAVTVGLELEGVYWKRGKDRFGIAAGRLDTSKGFQAAAPYIDVDNDLNADFGYLPAGAEEQYEIYYAWKLNDYLELSPDYQWIRNPAGDSLAKNVSIMGLRAKLAF